MQPWTQKILTDTDDPALAEYVGSCEDYFLRQLLVYEHWPQQEYTTLGYTGETVFQDQNA